MKAYNIPNTITPFGDNDAEFKQKTIDNITELDERILALGAAMGSNIDTKIEELRIELTNLIGTEVGNVASDLATLTNVVNTLRPNFVSASIPEAGTTIVVNFTSDIISIATDLTAMSVATTTGEAQPVLLPILSATIDEVDSKKVTFTIDGAIYVDDVVMCGIPSGTVTNDLGLPNNDIISDTVTNNSTVPVPEPEPEP